MTIEATSNDDHFDRPVEARIDGYFGSDAIAATMRALGVRYVALNPGASFRGVHDSLVNYLGNEAPSMLLCLHEEHAVAIAHGYAKVTEEPMAVFLHSNVGLMHGAMAIFNAWCDRVPMLIYGATGPVDAAHRRPWIDWIHTTTDQAALVRPYVKWDNQPASVPAALEAMIRADVISRTQPRGPTYVTFDTELQERAIPALPAPTDLSRFRPPERLGPSAAMIERALGMIGKAASPVILAGRVSRSTSDWARRVAFAERIGARVLTDQKLGAAFPTDHPAHVGAPRFFLDEVGSEAMQAADLIISLDWLDLAGTMRLAGQVDAPVIHVSMDYQLHGGWNMEHQALPAVDLHLPVDADLAVEALCEALSAYAVEEPVDLPVLPAIGASPWDAPLDMTTLAAALGEGLAGECATLVRLPLGWASEHWHFRHPLDFLGYDGGGGIGSGPGMLVGAALALKDSGRLPVAVLGDGDFVMANSAIWTAIHCRIPFLAVIANNRSFFNDEVHQERVAIARSRPVENKWVGQRIDGPDIDFAGLARSQGAVGYGPVGTVGDLVEALRQAVPLVRKGAGVVIDARVTPGYSKSMAAGLVRGS